MTTANFACIRLAVTLVCRGVAVTVTVTAVATTTAVFMAAGSVGGLGRMVSIVVSIVQR